MTGLPSQLTDKTLLNAVSQAWQGLLTASEEYAKHHLELLWSVPWLTPHDRFFFVEVDTKTVHLIMSFRAARPAQYFTACRVLRQPATEAEVMLFGALTQPWLRHNETAYVTFPVEVDGLRLKVTDATIMALLDRQRLAWWGEQYPFRLSALRAEYARIAELSSQKRGYALENLLGQALTLHGFAVTQPFRIRGEQIDGAFVLDREHFLVECKWQDASTPASSIYAFRGKVEGKMGAFGLFLSMNGFSEDAPEALANGKVKNVLLMDGEELAAALDGALRLDQQLQAKRTQAATKGDCYYRPHVDRS
jgi:hypothetical protein